MRGGGVIRTRTMEINEESLYIAKSYFETYKSCVIYLQPTTHDVMGCSTMALEVGLKVVIQCALFPNVNSTAV